MQKRTTAVFVLCTIKSLKFLQQLNFWRCGKKEICLIQAMLYCWVFITWGKGPYRSKSVARLLPQLQRCDCSIRMCSTVLDDFDGTE